MASGTQLIYCYRINSEIGSDYLNSDTIQNQLTLDLFGNGMNASCVMWQVRHT